MEVNQEKKWCVYKHTNKVNGKVYIGQTCEKPEKRWKNGKAYTGSVHFYAAIQKYGWDNFEHEVLFTNLTWEEANQIEIELIKYYDSTDPKKGYNIRSGGSNGTFSKESRERMSEAHKGKRIPEEIRKKMSESHIGYKHTEEARQNMSKAQKGRIVTEEHKRKIREANKKNPGYWKGKKLSEEHIRKMAESKKGFKMSEETKEKLRKINIGKKHTEEAKKKMGKPVQCVETGIIYYSSVEAEKQTGCNQAGIKLCCYGKQKTCGGYHWRYPEKDEEEEE